MTSRIRAWLPLSLVRTAALAAGLLSMTIGGAAIGAAVSHSGGAVTKVYTVTSADSVSTSSYTPSDVPSMTLTIHVPSGQKALLVITFSSESQCDNPTEGLSCFVDALVNGSPANPAGVSFDTSGHTELEARSMQWTYGPVSPGDYVVKVQYHGNTPPAATSQFNLRSRTLTVLRSKV